MTRGHISVTCQYKAAVCNGLVLCPPRRVELLKSTDVQVVDHIHNA